MLQNAPPCLSRPNGMGGDECSDFKSPIGRTSLSGNRIFAEAGKSRLSVKPRLVGGELHLTEGMTHNYKRSKKDGIKAFLNSDPFLWSFSNDPLFVFGRSLSLDRRNMKKKSG